MVDTADKVTLSELPLEESPPLGHREGADDADRHKRAVVLVEPEQQGAWIEGPEPANASTRARTAAALLGLT